MKIEGKLHALFATQQVSEKFKKREFVVEYKENPLYPQYVKFDLIQDKCDLLDQYQVGDEIEITFNLKGREWIAPDGEKKYFNTLEAWLLKKSENQPQDTSTSSKDSPVYNMADIAADEGDDLPF